MAETRGEQTNTKTPPTKKLYGLLFNCPSALVMLIFLGQRIRHLAGDEGNEKFPS